MSVMDNTTIRNFLPHRYPFLLVDRVLSFHENKSIVAIKNVTCNEPFFNGHFPQTPIMPGVLMIEALAQTAGLLYYHISGLTSRNETDMFFLAGVDEARFKRMVVPGDQLTLKVEVVKRKLNLWKFTGTALVGDDLACSASFMIIRE